jgi:hypothetical protein
MDSRFSPDLGYKITTSNASASTLDPELYSNNMHSFRLQSDSSNTIQGVQNTIHWCPGVEYGNKRKRAGIYENDQLLLPSTSV